MKMKKKSSCKNRISCFKRGFCIVFIFILLVGQTSFLVPTYVKAEPENAADTSEPENAADTDGAADMGDAAAPEESADNEEESDLWPEGIPKSQIAAESACLMDVNSGAVLYEKNARKAQFPASITKVMTCLVALENSSLSENVTFSSDAVYGIEPGSAHIAAEVGEVMTMEQCYYGMLLPSANEVCLAVAEHIGGSKEKFADMMNEKAEELGCVNSHFVNPNGLHDENHYTCAYDMALIARAAYQYETFRTVCGTKYYTMEPTNKKKEERGLLNAHQMVYGWKYPQYQYEYCVGGKTGYTDKSLWTLVTFAKKDGMTLVAVVMRDYGPTYEANEYTDSKALFEYAFEHYYIYDVSNLTETNALTKEDSVLFTRFSPLFDENQNEIYMAKGGSVILPNGADTSQITQQVEYYDEAKDVGGQHVIGRITYEYGGKTIGESDICYRKSDSPRLVTNEKKNKEVKTLLKDVETESKKKMPVPFIIIIIAVVLAAVIFAGWMIIRRRRHEAEFSFYRNRTKKLEEGSIGGSLDIEIKRGKKAKGDRRKPKRW